MKIIPVTLITGFLGSGKTTLINQILGMRPEMKISVVLNEFGDTKLESQFVKGHKGDIFELSNGCMCCVAQEDFVRVVKWIMEEKPETEHVLIEASGASDPLPVISTFRESDIANQVQLATVVCVVDAMNFFEMKEKYKTVLVQLSNSDMALISKVTEAGEGNVKRVQDFIKGFVPRMWVGRVDHAININLILDANYQKPPQGDFAIINNSPKGDLRQIMTNKQLSIPHTHSHEGDKIESLVWRSDTMLDFDRVNNFLRSLPASVIRVKGVLNLFVDNQPRKFLLQYVGERSEVHEAVWNSEEQPYTEIVCVGAGFDTELLKQRLEECVKK